MSDAGGRSDPLVSVRAAERLVDAVEHDRDAARAAGRRSLGVDGETAIEGFGPSVATRGRATLWLTAVIAGILAAPLALIAVVGPRVAADRGQSGSLLLAAIGTWAAGAAYGALVSPALARRSPARFAGRQVVAMAGGVLCGVGLVLVQKASFVGGACVSGLGAGVASGALLPLAVDWYPAGVRARVVAFARAGWFGGALAATALSAITQAATAMSAATTMGVVGGLGVALSVLAGSLRDPGRGLQDRRGLRAILGDGVPDVVDLPVSWRAGIRRVVLVPSVRACILPSLALGVWLVAIHVYVIRIVGLRWGAGPWGRGVTYAAGALAGVAACALSGPRLESAFRNRPGRVARMTGSAMAAAGVACMLVGAWPSSGGAVFVVATMAFGAVAFVGIDLIVQTAARPAHRSSAAAMSLAFVGAGAVASIAVLNLLDIRRGPGAPVIVAGILTLLAAQPLRRVGEAIAADLDVVVADEIEVADLDRMVARGDHLPLLACRHVNFSYGPVQVLFDVSFTVDDGEMVALLGTNGAGKSTLLRLISGLGFPSSGSVRLGGVDISHLDPASRVQMGIAQIPGGRAVFGSMTVVENLRNFAYTLGKDRAAVARGIDAAFDAFPRLGERREQLAQTLSGGERQMLALSKALIVRPRLLLIDELSLGLAPAVVGELLDMVRTINRTGTAVVLVEQSVNVALSLVDHAYYMEKGEMRFDGPAQELIGRPDLLRSVYLKGVAEGLAG